MNFERARLSQAEADHEVHEEKDRGTPLLHEAKQGYVAGHNEEAQGHELRGKETWRETRISSRLNEASDKFAKKCSGNQKHCETTTSKGINSKFLVCTCHVTPPGESSMQLLTAKRGKFPSTQDFFAKRLCTTSLSS